MNDSEKKQLVDLKLAPYIQKATSLIGQKRKVGGNQFRHAIATMGILIDYHYIDGVLLKASVIHDLFEDVPDFNPDEVRAIDFEGNEVVNLVYEVTKRDETKAEFLSRILNQGSFKAKVLKVADRISNLTDLHMDIFSVEFIEHYLDESELYVLPIAMEVNENMAIEIKDLIHRRRKLLNRKALVDNVIER
jgi:(p)ppGpp synthase/HD superfamily hydrolase